MSKNIDYAVTKEPLLKQLNDAVTKYKATKDIGKENIIEQTTQNKQQTIALVNNMQKRLEFLKNQI